MKYMLPIMLCFVFMTSYGQSFPKDYFNSKYPNVTTCIINDYDSLNPILGQDSIWFTLNGPTNYDCTTIQVMDSSFVINNVDTATVNPPMASEATTIVTREEVGMGTVEHDKNNSTVAFQSVGESRKYIYSIRTDSTGVTLIKIK
jgi:hypothetical protein